MEVVGGLVYRGGLVFGFSGFGERRFRGGVGLLDEGDW